METRIAEIKPCPNFADHQHWEGRLWKLLSNLPALDPERSEEELLHEAVTRRAHELWELHGKVDGHAKEDWAQAEAEVRSARHTEPRSGAAFVVVKVGEFTYTGEYDRQRASFYHPGDLGRGTPVPVRFEGDRMYLKLSGGRELETRIIRRSLV